jgi:UDP-N-acetylglucosamine:LPS N-acetylglucosamine transferase|tara:strand:+ start:254 stop:718 length:465 start_codon:yes stop_codon:yes gene_type:complete
MKICVPTGISGHLTEVLYLIEAFEGHDVFFIVTDGPRGRTLPYRTYVFPWEMASSWSVLKNMFHQLWALPRMFFVLWKERPDIIFSTGAEFALPFFFIGKLLGAQGIFVESLTRVHMPSLSGRLVYPICKLFLVQQPELLSHYGRKASYEGSII